MYILQLHQSIELEFFTCDLLLCRNIENNLFSGPIPPKLLTIPNFRSDMFCFVLLLAKVPVFQNLGSKYDNFDLPAEATWENFPLHFIKIREITINHELLHYDSFIPDVSCMS